MRNCVITAANHAAVHTEFGFKRLANAIGERNGLPSLTQPSQTLSLRTLIERYTRGQSVETFQPTYTDDTLIPDNYERLTEIERLEYAREMQSDLAEQVKRARPQKAAPDVVLETPGVAKTPDGE